MLRFKGYDKINDKGLLQNRLFIVGGIIIYYLTELSGKVYRLFYQSLENPFAILKFLVLALFSLCVFNSYDKKIIFLRYKYIIYIFLFFSILNLIGLLDGVLLPNLFIFNFKVFSKLFFPFFMFELYRYIKGTDNCLYEKIGFVFTFLLLINVFLQIVGFLFHVKFLSSYNFFRFGYSGFFCAQNEATGFYILMMLFSMNKIGSKKFFDCFVFLSSIIGGILLGTKGFLLFLCCFFVVQIFLIKNKRNKIIIGILFLLLMVISVISVIKIIEIFPDKNLLFVLSSQRNELLVNVYDKIKSYNLVQFFHLFFGGLPFKQLETQIEIIDIFLFCGVPMAFFYFYTFYSVFIKSVENKMIKASMVILYFIIGGLAGHIFISALNIPILGYVVSSFIKDS